jgi:hypothetical protein
VERAHGLAEYILGLTMRRERREEFLSQLRRESDVTH